MLPNLPQPKVGKVREVYDLGEQVLIVATDRISAFDLVMANGIPGKGQILNQMSAFWFAELRHVCPNHLLTISDEEIASHVGSAPELSGRAMLARRAEPQHVAISRLDRPERGGKRWLFRCHARIIQLCSAITSVIRQSRGDVPRPRA